MLERPAIVDREPLEKNESFSRMTVAFLLSDESGVEIGGVEQTISATLAIHALPSISEWRLALRFSKEIAPTTTMTRCQRSARPRSTGRIGIALSNV